MSVELRRSIGSIPVIVKGWSRGGQNQPFATFFFSSGATDEETIMNEISLLQSLGQVSASETGRVFRDPIPGPQLSREVPNMCMDNLGRRTSGPVVPSQCAAS